jgi:FAD/FMN-containing dehydrogenase
MPPAEYRPQQSPLVQPGRIDHQVNDMTVTAAGEVQLKILQAKLAENEQWLPIDGAADSPIGQLVERNSTGPLRLGWGAWRDLLLGCQFQNGYGQLITAGGRTMKNVAGYDLTKFMIGQYGIFGEVVTITARTYRRPAGALLVRFEPDIKILNGLLPTNQRPQWSILTADALLCGYLGDRRMLDYWESTFRDGPAEIVERALEEDMAHRADLFSGALANRFRASVPPSRITQFVEKCLPTYWAADAAFGIVVGTAAENLAEQAARDCGGSTSRPIGADSELLRRLKAAFDPDGKLQPLT